MKTNHIFAILALGLATLGLSACYDTEWDAPEFQNGLPYGNNAINEDGIVSIAQMKAQFPKYKGDYTCVEITDDIKLRVRVTGNDVTGNLYNNIAVQEDETGDAMIIAISGRDMFASMPVGQEMIIALKGLHLGCYGSQPQLGTPYTDSRGRTYASRMTETTWQEHVKLIGKPEPGKVVPVEFTANTDINEDCGKLMTIKNISIQGADGKHTKWAAKSDAGTGTSVAKFFVESPFSDGNKYMVYTSTYADFANTPIPSGKMNLTGIWKRYNNSWELIIRDINDIQAVTDEATDDDDPTQGDDEGDATGKGTAEEPFNVAAANKICAGLQQSTGSNATYLSDEVYVSGLVSEIGDMGNNGGLIYYISDDGTTANQLEVYYGLYLNGDQFTSADQLQVGDEVTVHGKLQNWKGTYEFTSGSKIVCHNGETADDGPDTPDPASTDPVGGMTITSSQIINGANGSVNLNTNNYGSQAVNTESSWYNFIVNGAGFTGCRVCIASESNGGGIQVQGNASDATKQGFITNVTPFNPIKTITVIAHVASSSQYGPSFNLYAGTETHPSGTAITGTSGTANNGDFTTYTFTYDLSSGNYSYFTIANDLQGVLYIDEIIIETK